MATGSSVGTAPVFALTRLSARATPIHLSSDRSHAPALSGAEGLLGLDFLRDQVLNIDFRLGQITLA